MRAMHSQQLDFFGSVRPWMQWVASPEGYVVVAPCVTLLVLVCGVYTFWRDLKRLFFKGMGPTLSHHRGAIIWLHGTGDSGSGFGFLRKMVGGELGQVKWVLPDAPKQRLHAAHDSKKRAWFDVKHFPIKVTGDYCLTSTAQDAEGLERSIERVHALIRAEIAQGIPASRIVLGGFSQGAALALWAAARYDRELGGVALWSGFAPLADELASVLHDACNKGTPHLCCHGDADEKILPECGAAVCELLRQAGVPVTQKVYPGMNHECYPSQVDDLKIFLRRQIVPSD